MEEQQVDLRDLPGLIATVVTTGFVTPEYAFNLMELRSTNETNDFRKIEYRQFDAKLVEAGRDAVIAHAMQQNYEWVLQVDADAAPFPPNALIVMLQDAYLDFPDADVISGYSQLKAPVPLPTIDTGTGTWEEWYPESGVLPVIRTGAHFLLTKKSAFIKMGEPPWFRTRHSDRPIDAMHEVDNFARCKLDGKNPFTEIPEWETLLASAREASAGGPSHVGEDSGFCDRLLASGGRIYVDTRILAGHMDKKYITPDELREAMTERDMQAKLACGVME